MAVPGSAAVSPSPLPSPAPEQAEAEAEAEATARATRRPSCGSGGVVGGGGEAKETIGLWGSRVVMGRGGGGCTVDENCGEVRGWGRGALWLGRAGRLFFAFCCW